MLIAVASTDGKRVDEHFGKATQFWIYDMSKSRQTLVMVRNITPLSTGDRNHPFDPERMKAAVESIKDCELVYCTKIGERPRQELEKAGISTMISNDEISSIRV